MVGSVNDAGLRWLLKGNSTPWYPSMRLFRQRNLGDWSTVFAELETELRSLVAHRRQVNRTGSRSQPHLRMTSHIFADSTAPARTREFKKSRHATNYSEPKERV